MAANRVKKTSHLDRNNRAVDRVEHSLLLLDCRELLAAYIMHHASNQTHAKCTSRAGRSFASGGGETNESIFFTSKKGEVAHACARAKPLQP